MLKRSLQLINTDGVPAEGASRSMRNLLEKFSNSMPVLWQ